MKTADESPKTTTAPSQDPSEQLRSRVTQIMSETANGCLKELGYKPDFKRRLKQAEKTIDDLRMDNSKLYIDNRTMKAHLALQNDRISFHESSADEQWRRNVQLREKNYHLELQYGELKARYEAHVQGLPNEQAWSRLLCDLDKANQIYRQAVAENTTSQFEVQRLTDQCKKHGIFKKPHVRGSLAASSVPNMADYRRASDGHLTGQQTGRPNQTALATLTTNPFAINSTGHQSPTFVAAPPARRVSAEEISMGPYSAGGTRRSIIDLTDEATGSRKKPRMDSMQNRPERQPTVLQPDLNSRTSSAPNPAEPSPVSSRTLSPPTQLPHTPSMTLTPAMQSVSINQDATMNEEPDRAKLMECVDAIMQEGDATGTRICRLCVVRHELQMVTTPPEPWVSASFEQLLAHCKSEHPAAWQQVLEAEEDDEEEEEEGGAAEA